MMGDVIGSIRLEIPADLTEVSYLDAVKKLGQLDKGIMLIVSPIDAVDAGRLAERHGLSVIVLPMLKTDAWSLVGKYWMVYSDGA